MFIANMKIYRIWLKGPYRTVKLFIEFLELTARLVNCLELFNITTHLVNNLSDAPGAQDNLSKLITALSA